MTVIQESQQKSPSSLGMNDRMGLVLEASLACQDSCAFKLLFTTLLGKHIICQKETYHSLVRKHLLDVPIGKGDQNGFAVC